MNTNGNMSRAWPVWPVDSRVYLPVGLETAPSMVFSNEPTTGIYLDSPGTSSSFAISKRGTKRVWVDDTGDLTVDGKVTATEFIGGGTSSTYDLAEGSAAAPSLRFVSDSTTGLYLDEDAGTGQNGIGFSSGGVKKFKVGTTSNTSFVPLVTASGTAGAPGLTFGDEPDTGLYLDLVTHEGIGFSVNGAKRMKLDDSSGLTCSIPISSGTYSLTTGDAKCTSLTSTGVIDCGTNALISGATSHSGILNMNSHDIQSAGVTTTSTLHVTGTASITGPMSCGSLTSGALSCTSLTSSGSMSCGTNALSCGPLTSTDSGSFLNTTVPLRLGGSGHSYDINLDSSPGTSRNLHIYDVGFDQTFDFGIERTQEITASTFNPNETYSGIHTFLSGNCTVNLGSTLPGGKFLFTIRTVPGVSITINTLGGQLYGTIFAVAGGSTAIQNKTTITIGPTASRGDLFWFHGDPGQWYVKGFIATGTSVVIT